MSATLSRSCCQNGKRSSSTCLISSHFFSVLENGLLAASLASLHLRLVQFFSHSLRSLEMDSKPRATRKVEHQGKRLSYHGFPQGCRLNAVTDKSVVTLSSTGVSKIFSSKAGFVSSAKEAENGSGLIAIADNHVILLHDLKRGAKLQYKLGKTEVGVSRCLQLHSSIDWISTGCHSLSYI